MGLSFPDSIGPRGRPAADAPTRAAADEVIAALAPSPEGFVVAEAHRGAGVAACTGVTVYLPSPLVGLSRFYADLDFAQEHGWRSMVDAYVRA